MFRIVHESQIITFFYVTQIGMSYAVIFEGSRIFERKIFEGVQKFFALFIGEGLTDIFIYDRFRHMKWRIK